MAKPWEKNSSDPTFNEFYTLPENAEKIFRPIRAIQSPQKAW